MWLTHITHIISQHNRSSFPLSGKLLSVWYFCGRYRELFSKRTRFQHKIKDSAAEVVITELAVFFFTSNASELWEENSKLWRICKLNLLNFSQFYMKFSQFLICYGALWAQHFWLFQVRFFWNCLFHLKCEGFCQGKKTKNITPCISVHQSEF